MQRNLVYRRKNWPLLRNPDEPATARIGDEVVQLLPIDRTKDEPNTQKSINKCLSLMRESDSWDNVIPFLMGLKNAKRKLRDDTMSRLVRYLVDAGRREQLLLLFTKTNDTGVGLWDRIVVREAMWGAWRAPGEWNQTTIRKGANFAESIWALMHDTKHTKHMTRFPRPTACPEIIAVLMLMHAAKAIAAAANPAAPTTSTTANGNEDAEVDDKAKAKTKADTAAADAARTRVEVEKYAKLMFRHWDSIDWSIGSGSGSEGEADWSKANHQMCMWAPMLQAMQAAAHVLGKGHPVSATLTAKSAEVAKLLDQARAIVEANSEDGAKIRRGVRFEQELAERFSAL